MSFWAQFVTTFQMEKSDVVQYNAIERQGYFFAVHCFRLLLPIQSTLYTVCDHFTWTTTRIVWWVAYDSWVKLDHLSVICRFSNSNAIQPSDLKCGRLSNSCRCIISNFHSFDDFNGTCFNRSTSERPELEFQSPIWQVHTDELLRFLRAVYPDESFSCLGEGLCLSVRYT